MIRLDKEDAFIGPPTSLERHPVSAFLIGILLFGAILGTILGTVEVANQIASASSDFRLQWIAIHL